MLKNKYPIHKAWEWEKGEVVINEDKDDNFSAIKCIKN